jgi:large repetitive protein
VTVSGWAVDNTAAVGTAISSVQVKVDGSVVGTATYGLSRPDVCAVYPGRPGCPNVGYSFSLDTSTWTAGTHTITVTATDSDAAPDTGSASVSVTK